MLGGTQSVALLDNVSTNFLPGQVLNAVKFGFNPTVYAAEAAGLALAGQAAFQPLVALSTAAFVSQVAISTGVNSAAITNFLNNWIAFYTANPSATQGLSIQQAARGATFGDAAGVALLNATPANLQTVISTNAAANQFSPNTVNGLVANALMDNATGQYVTGVSLGALAPHNKVQGEAGSGGLILTVGIDSPTQGFQTGTGGTITTANGVFTAPPGVAPFGGPSNTLQAGDNLVSTVGDATLNVTMQAPGIAGNPALANTVTMTGVATANITNASFGLGGFSGPITGLTTLNMQAGTNGNVLVGLASQGLNTALQTVGVFANSNLTAWVAAAALAGATNAVTVNVNSSLASSLDLNVTGGGANGYETATINSQQDAPGQTNPFEFDVNHTSLATINATGPANLTMTPASSALNLATLVTFNGTAATGMLDISFPGAGDVVVDGGSNNDTFTFPAGNAAGAVTVRGNAGNDTFVFLTTNGGGTTFNANDSADGGAGNNRLRLQVDTGVILAGGTILNIQVIEHFANGVVNGALSADMSLSGSATVLELAADYDGNDVAITNLVTAKSILFTGDNIDDMDLDATSLLGTVTLTMAQTATGGTQNINDLDVVVGNQLNLTSAGNAATNLIQNVAGVDANVLISGPHNLLFGFNPALAKATNAANAYDFDGGIIDATAMTGPLSIGLETGRQQVALGTGNDLVHIWTAGAGDPKLIQMGPLATGGSDTVQFHATTQDGTLSITPTTLGTINYTRIEGFNVNDIPNGNAHDTIQIDAGGGAFEIPIVETNGAAVFNPPAIFLMTTGLVTDLSAQFVDIIKFSTAVGAFTTPQTLFNNAIGAGSITVATVGAEHLAMLWNNDNGVTLLFTVNDGGGIINAGDDVDVVAVIPMSFTDFNTFGNNGSIAFV
jgi:hypothetical protein